jgi:hypothetical protein
MLSSTCQIDKAYTYTFLWPWLGSVFADQHRYLMEKYSATVTKVMEQYSATLSKVMVKHSATVCNVMEQNSAAVSKVK